MALPFWQIPRLLADWHKFRYSGVVLRNGQVIREGWTGRYMNIEAG